MQEGRGRGHEANNPGRNGRPQNPAQRGSQQGSQRGAYRGTIRASQRGTQWGFQRASQLSALPGAPRGIQRGSRGEFRGESRGITNRGAARARARGRARSESQGESGGSEGEVQEVQQIAQFSNGEQPEATSAPRTKRLDWKLKTPSSGGPHSWNDELELQKRNREREFTEGIAKGLIADPNKPRRLDEAITIVGTCQDMCPAHERAERVVTKDIWTQELDPNQGREQFDQATAKRRMVKKFRRAAAGMGEQLPSDLRPLPVLKKTLDYLFNDYLIEEPNFGKAQEFLWDRTRSVRNDISIQRFTKPADVAMAIDCYERIARFHILSLHQMARFDDTPESYSRAQDMEQFDRTFMSLLELYSDNAGRYTSPNEAEFLSYYIIYRIQDPSPDIVHRLQLWKGNTKFRSNAVQDNPQIKRAFELYAAASNLTDSQGPLRPRHPHIAAQQDWQKFWRLVKSHEISYLESCVAEIYFNLNRRTALEAIWLAYGYRTANDLKMFEIADMLAFDNEHEAHSFCQAYGFKLAPEPDGTSRLDLHSFSGNKLPDPSDDLKAQFFSENLVEFKRYGRSLSAVINGDPVESDSLFLPADPTTNLKLDTNDTSESMSDREEEQNSTEPIRFVPIDRKPSTDNLTVASTASEMKTGLGKLPSSFQTQSGLTSGTTASTMNLSGPQLASTPTSTASTAGFGKPSAAFGASTFSVFSPFVPSSLPEAAKPAKDPTLTPTFLAPTQLGTQVNFNAPQPPQDGYTLQAAAPKLSPAFQNKHQPSRPSPLSNVTNLTREASEPAQSRQEVGLTASLPSSNGTQSIHRTPEPSQTAQSGQEKGSTASLPSLNGAQSFHTTAEPSQHLDGVQRKAQNVALQSLAHEVLFDERAGLLRQFIEHTYAGQVNSALSQFKEEEKNRREVEASNIRLAVKYGQRWRKNCWKLKMSRKGRNMRQRRQTLLAAQEQTVKRSLPSEVVEKREAQPKKGLTANSAASSQVKSHPKRGSEELESEPEITVLKCRKREALPYEAKPTVSGAEYSPSGAAMFDHIRDPASFIQPTRSRPASVRDDRRGDDRRTNGESSRRSSEAMTPLSLPKNTSPQQPFIGSSLLAHSLSTPTIDDFEHVGRGSTVRSAYFQLKAMGINPNAGQNRKRARESSVTSRPSLSSRPEPKKHQKAPLARPAGIFKSPDRSASSKPRFNRLKLNDLSPESLNRARGIVEKSDDALLTRLRRARESAAVEVASTTQNTSRQSSQQSLSQPSTPRQVMQQPSPNSESPTNIQDEELFKKVREVHHVMADSMTFFQEEVEKVRSQTSSRSSNLHGENGLTNIDHNRTSMSVGEEDLPQYRLRESKFVPREMYGKWNGTGSLRKDAVSSMGSNASMEDEYNKDPETLAAAMKIRQGEGKQKMVDAEETEFADNVEFNGVNESIDGGDNDEVMDEDADGEVDEDEEMEEEESDEVTDGEGEYDEEEEEEEDTGFIPSGTRFGILASASASASAFGSASQQSSLDAKGKGGTSAEDAFELSD
ncbi:MAG: hypothetical protein M1820_004802 [Bogoriella megaspora]|nr:MAG: hypothetical protein M1820_004802 [Bogoriella megaspora]